MHFVNSRKKSGFSFLTFFVVLLSIASITFGAVDSSADSNQNNQVETERFNFLSNSPATFFFGNNNVAQSSFASLSSLGSQSNQSEEILDSEVFNQFDAWVKSYVGNGYRADSEQVMLGENLALKRKQSLKQLIEINPQSALEKALSAETIDQLPEFIVEHTEKRVGATGDFLVYVLDGMNHSHTKRGSELTGESRTTRAVVIGETKYKASVYGRRLTMTTKLDIPLQGIIIDDTMAVDESPAEF